MLIALPAVAAQVTNKTRQTSNGMPVACVVTLKGLPIFYFTVNEEKLSKCVNGFLQKLKKDLIIYQLSISNMLTLIITI